MNNSLTITQAAKLMGFSRQHIAQQIYEGNLPATRKQVGRNDYLLSPDVLAGMAHTRYKGLLASIGVFVFADVLYSNDSISQEQYDEIKSTCVQLLKSIQNIEALKPMVDDIVERFPNLRVDDNSAA